VELGCGAWLWSLVVELGWLIIFFFVYVNIHHDHCPFTAISDPTTITKYNPSMPVCPVRVCFHGMLELHGIEGRRAGKTKKQ
jgi:hypothetical protein